MGLFAMLDACQRELLSDYFAASMCDPASPSAGFRSADRLTNIATHVNATPVIRLPMPSPQQASS